MHKKVRTPTSLLALILSIVSVLPIQAADCPFKLNLKVAQVFGPMSHNTYKEMAYQEALTKVKAVEIDIWDCKTYPPVPVITPCNGLSGDWYVRHSPNGGNKNHCGKGNQPFSVCLKDIKDWHDANSDHRFVTVFVDKKEAWGTSRWPADLDTAIKKHFDLSMILTPHDLLKIKSSDSLRQAAQDNVWPTEGELKGKFMFILTGGKFSNHNQTQSEYVADREDSAVLFVAPDADELTDITEVPNQFSEATAKWVVAYNFNWKRLNEKLGHKVRDLNYLDHSWSMKEDCDHYATAVKTFRVNYVGLDDLGLGCENSEGGYNCDP